MFIPQYLCIYFPEYKIIIFIGTDKVMAVMMVLP